MHGVIPRRGDSRRRSRPCRQAGGAAGDARHTPQADRHARRRSSPPTGPASCGVGTSRSPAPPISAPILPPICVRVDVRFRVRFDAPPHGRAAVQRPAHRDSPPAPRHDLRQARTTPPADRGRRSAAASESPGVAVRCRSAAFRRNRSRLCLFLPFQPFQPFRPVFARDSLERLRERLPFQPFQRPVPVWRAGHQAPLPTPCSASARTG